MATLKKAKGPSMIETFQEFKETKNIDRTTLVSVLEESFRNVIAKMFGSDENFDVIVNPDKGDFEIHRNRIVVADGEVQDENKEISLSEAQKIEPDRLSALRFTRFGSVKYCSSTTRATSSTCLSRNRFLQTTTTRARPSVQLSRKYRTRTTIHASS